MMDKKIKYEYKGNTYEFYQFGKMKHPDTRKWLLCVYYKDGFGNMFCRELNDFDEKFKLLK